MPAAPKGGMATLLAQAEKKYNLTVGPMGSIASDTKFITTGNLAIDYALGGGIPMGRSVELLGPPSSGKTTLALQAAIAMQKLIIAGGDPERGIGPDDMILYFDYEQAMDPEYATALGLDMNHPSLQFTQPDTLEEGADFALAAFKTGQVRLALFDSVAAMNPSAQAEADSVGKSLPAVQAKLMKPFGVTLNSVLRNNNGTVIFINHEMVKMEMGGGGRPGYGPPPTTTPGGSALKYFASVRVSFKQIRQNKGIVMDPVLMEEKEIPVSTDVRVKVIKNKVAPPFREATVRVTFGRGFDQFWTAMQVLLANKKVMYQTGRYYFHKLEEIGGAPEWMPRESKGTNRPYLHGEKRVFSLAEQYPEWRELLVAQAKLVAEENVESLGKVAPIKAEVMSAEEDSDEVTSEDLDDLIPKDAAGNRAEI